MACSAEARLRERPTGIYPGVFYDGIFKSSDSVAQSADLSFR